MTHALLNEDVPIFTCDCHEPKGIVKRSVYPMILTHENLMCFWEKTNKFRILFDNEVTDFKSFCEMFISVDPEYSSVQAHGLFWRIDDFVGMYYMTHIQAHDAQIHYSFFDRRHHGRQLMTRRMIQHVFTKYGFQRLSAEIPFCARGTFDFVSQVGMKDEGRKRKAVLFDNEWFDVRCYGVLKEEAEQWQ